MDEFWERAFTKNKLMWGQHGTASADLAAARFAQQGVRDVLIPGIGYGRNAKVFLERGMRVTGIEISETAIALARRELGLDLTIHQGSVGDMPFDESRYDAVFCFGLLYLLDPAGRAKLLRDCANQVVPGGPMVFTLVSKQASMYRQGTRIDEDWYETEPGVRIYFYDEHSVRREFADYGPLEISTVQEPMTNGTSRPFLYVVCRGRLAQGALEPADGVVRDDG